MSACLGSNASAPLWSEKDEVAVKTNRTVILFKDTVQSRFREKPEVYGRFTDLMKLFKNKRQAFKSAKSNGFDVVRFDFQVVA
jgi:hypothetical protein